VKRHGVLWGAWVLTFLLASCSSPSRESLGSVVWMQSSPEYRAAALQAYRAAGRQLAPALADRTWTAAAEQTGDPSGLPPAVILDVDETVLDNSRYLGQLILERKTHNPEAWDAWVAMRRAPAVPGAAAFVHAARHMGITPVYVTNRQCRKRAGTADACPQKLDTLENLRRAGFAPVDPAHLLLRGERQGWGADKSSRRAHVARSYRVLMLVGDSLLDFVPVERPDDATLQRPVCPGGCQEMWGWKWFVLPNPAYGSWSRILKEPVSECVQGYQSRAEPPAGP